MNLMDILIVTKVLHKLQKLVIYLMDILIVKHVHGELRKVVKHLMDVLILNKVLHELKKIGDLLNGYFNSKTCSWRTETNW